MKPPAPGKPAAAPSTRRIASKPLTSTSNGSQPQLSFTSNASRASPSSRLPGVSPARSASGSASPDKGKQRATQPLSASRLSSAHASPAEEKPQPQLKGENGEGPSAAAELWADRFQPASREALAVHKRKVADVEGWLRDCFDGPLPVRRYRRLLALSGPPGSGKTAVIRALASELDYEILEWQNSVNPHGRVGDGLGSGPASLTRRFEEFLAQAGRFPTLSLSSRQGGADAGHAAASQGQSQAGPSRRRLILLEDLPNLTHQTTRESFIAALELFLARALPSDGFPTPLVLIMSDSVVRQDADVGRMGDSSRSESVRTAMSLRIRSNPAYAEIAFRPVAKTFLVKTLASVLTTVREDPASTLPAATSAKGKALLDHIAEESSGDIRGALNLLQMAGQMGWEADRSKKRARGATKKDAEVAREAIQHKLTALAGRQSPLALFHALGRILYNKRLGDPDEPEYTAPAEPPDWELPAHLQDRQCRPSKVDLDAFWLDLPIDVSLLSLYLHQNYPPFCGAEIESSLGVIEALSLADAELHTSSDEWLHYALSSHYTFQHVVRSTLASLPSPVPRLKQVLTKAAFFEANAKAREAAQAVDDAAAGWVADGITQQTRETLATETLPMLWRIAPEGMPPAAEHIGHMPWLHGAASQQQTLGEDEEGEEEPPPLTAEPKQRTVARVPKPAANELLYDEDDDIENDSD